MTLIDRHSANLCFQPWNEIVLPNRVAETPALIHASEKRFLYYAARETYRGWGEIVDAGCFAGGSTMALAHGLEDNKQARGKDGRLHVYDRFVVDPSFRGSARTMAVIDNAQTDADFFAQFERNTQGFERYIQLYKGDILEMSWAGKPIELYSLDVAKTWAIMRWVADNHFPFFERGTVLFHQDFFDPRSYQLPMVMGYYEDCFEVVGATEGVNLIFVCTKKPSPMPDLREVLSLDEALSLHNKFFPNFDLVRKAQTAIGAAMICRWFGDEDRFKNLLLDAESRYGDLPRAGFIINRFKSALLASAPEQV